MSESTGELGASFAVPLPPRVECCECGHPKPWHAAKGWCRVALDIDEECPCKCYAPKLTLILDPDSPAKGGGR